MVVFKHEMILMLKEADLLLIFILIELPLFILNDFLIIIFELSMVLYYDFR